MQRVVITGLGIVSSIGSTVAAVLESLQNGRSGIEQVPEWKELGFRNSIAGRPKDFDLPSVAKRNLRQMGRGSELAFYAATSALFDAGLERRHYEHERAGFVIGNIGNMRDIHRQCLIRETSVERLAPAAYPRAMGCSVSANLSVLLGTRGYNLTVTAACASGAAAIGMASRLIRTGEQDLCICGGVQEDSWEYFCQLDAVNVFSRCEQEPVKASRPFDIRRDGLVPSAGCGLLVLESEDNARRRGARIYAELAGYAFRSDGIDMTRPSGQGSVNCIEAALADAGVTPAEVDYVNAHATSTQVGDAMEAGILSRIFGKGVPVSSTKSMTGHEQAASGSNELIYTLLMMQHDFIAPTINLQEIDPLCSGIHIISQQPVDAHLYVAASNSFGFGGVNTCLVVRRFTH
jgi:3-oxoacyl-[acyl-carrier-protein] synthase-1